MRQYKPQRYRSGYGAVQQPAIPAYSPRSPRPPRELESSTWGTKMEDPSMYGRQQPQPVEEENYMSGSDARDFK